MKLRTLDSAGGRYRICIIDNSEFLASDIITALEELQKYEIVGIFRSKNLIYIVTKRVDWSGTEPYDTAYERLGKVGQEE